MGPDAPPDDGEKTDRGDHDGHVRKRERWREDEERRTKEALAEAGQEIYDSINGSSVPLSQRQAELVSRREGTEVTLGEVGTAFKKAMENGDWNDALKKFFTLIFGARYDVRGLGVFAKEIGHIPLREQVGIVAKMAREEAGAAPRTFHDRFFTSVLRAKIGMHLRSRGYALKDMARPAGEPRRVASGAYLRDHVKPEVWRELAPESGDPLFIGPIALFQPLPEGWLYFDAHSIPLFLSKEKIDAAKCPPVPIFEKTLPPAREGQSQEERAIEFLEQELQPGDIILVSMGGRNQRTGEEQSFGREFLERGIRKGQQKEEDFVFHAGHVMVYDGALITHLLSRGEQKRSASVRDTFERGRYNAVTVVRIRDSRCRGDFLTRAKTVIGGTKGYDLAELTGMATQRFFGFQLPGTKGGKPDACICSGLVTRSAEGIPGLEQLASAKSAEDIARCSAVDLPYSVEFGRE